MENHNYWALASDLHNVLGNKALARAFLRDPALVDLWCNFIAFFQGNFCFSFFQFKIFYMTLLVFVQA